MADVPKTYKVALNAVSEAQSRQRDLMSRRTDLMNELAEVEDDLAVASQAVGDARTALQLRIDADLADAAEKAEA